jgi:molecular chaperone DnaK (HSP70)
MIGIDIGSLNTTVSLGKQNSSTSKFQCELILSDTSSRSCPSIITYTETLRLIGDQASLVLRSNIQSSFHYLSRLIGILPNSNFGKREFNEYILYSGNYNPQNNTFNFTINNQNYSFSPDEIIVGYLNKVKYQYIIEQRIQPIIYVFSVPDYFTCHQKLSYLNIIRACDIKDNFHLINDSTAITLYFGYKKFKDYFIVHTNANNNPNAVSVNPTITKYIIFIDSGHSKTTFVLSKLNYNLFTVLDCFILPFFGGRDFDEEIYKFCSQKFKEKTGINILNNQKIKLRLLQVITKARKALTVNQDASISIDCLCDDNDFSYILTRNEFEQIIKGKVNEFKNAFLNFYNKSLNTFKGIEITNVEMAGELMRTPVLEKIVKEITKIEMSKTILTDECIAIGCSLYGSLLQNCFPILNFQGIYHLNNYSILYSINNQQQKILLSNHENIPYFPEIILDSSYFNKNLITIGFYHNPNEIQYYLPCQTGLLLEYEINTNVIMKLNGGINNIILDIMIDNNGMIFIKNLKSKDKNNNFINIPLNQNDAITISKREIYQNPKNRMNLILQMTKKENELIKRDEDFKLYSNKRNQLEGNVYDIKNKISGKPISNQNFNGKPLSVFINDIENKLNDIQNQITDLSQFQKVIEQIFNFITPSGIVEPKKELMEQISYYQNNVSEEYSKLLSGQNCKFNEKQIEDISNMLGHFKTKIGIEDNIQNLNELKRELISELKKYFN